MTHALLPSLLVSVSLLVGCGRQDIAAQALASSVELSRLALSASERHAVHGFTTDVRDGLVRTRATIHTGFDPLDQFEVTVVLPEAQAPMKSSVILLPGGPFRFDMFEVPAGHGYRSTLAGTLAAAGHAVVGYSHRGHTLAPGACAEREDACREMGQWGFDRLLEDVAFLTAVARALSPGRPFIGGLSLGAMLATAAVNLQPRAYAGVFLIDGALFSQDANVRRVDADLCQAQREALAAGKVGDDASSQAGRTVFTLAETDPSGQSPFVPALTNRQMFLTLLSTPQPSFVPAMVFAAGDVLDDRLHFADEGAVRAIERAANAYDPTVLVRDVACALAGDDRFTRNLGAFRGRVLAFGSGLGFGRSVDDTTSLFTSATSVRVMSEPAFGHLDFIVHRRRPALLDAPLLDWL